MSTSFLGLSIRDTILPTLTSLLYTLGISAGAYNFIDPVAGAKGFGIVLPGSEPTPTEAAYTRIAGIRNLANGVVGLGMVWYLVYGEASNAVTTGLVVAAALRRVIGYSMVFGTVVALVDGWILKRFSGAEGVSQEAVETAEKQRRGHMFMGLPIVAIGLGWIYA